MTDVTNKDRANWAEAALIAFGKETGQYKPKGWGEEIPCVISDLICNLMHYCRQNGIDTDKMLAYGKGNFEEELAEEPFERGWLCVTEDQEHGLPEDTYFSPETDYENGYEAYTGCASLYGGHFEMYFRTKDGVRHAVTDESRPEDFLESEDDDGEEEDKEKGS